MTSHLTVLHPHREPPEDIVYRGREEAANCSWCRWHEYSLDCLHPEQRFGNKTDMSHFPRGDCRDWNCDGSCTRYEPSRWTRFLRRFGLRRPAWRSNNTNRENQATIEQLKQENAELREKLKPALKNDLTAMSAMNMIRQLKQENAELRARLESPR